MTVKNTSWKPCAAGEFGENQLKACGLCAMRTGTFLVCKKHCIKSRMR